MSAEGERRHEFPTRSSRTAYLGHILALRVDEVAMPGGRSATREVIEHYGAVAVVALDEQNEVLLIHQYRHPLGRRLWELPAGLLDAADETAQQTARRELIEEAGHDAGELSVLVDIAASAGMTDEVTRVFLARRLRAVPRPCGPDDEEADLVISRFPLRVALDMVFRGEIINGASIAGLLAADAVLAGRARARPPQAPWPDRPVAFAARHTARADTET